MTLLDQGLGSHADAPHKGREPPIWSVGAEVLPLATSADACRGRRPRCVNPDIKSTYSRSLTPPFSNLTNCWLHAAACQIRICADVITGERSHEARLNGIPADGALGQADEFPISSSSIRSSLAPVDILASTHSSAIPPRICQISASVIARLESHDDSPWPILGANDSQFPARRLLLA